MQPADHIGPPLLHQRQFLAQVVCQRQSLLRQARLGWRQVYILPPVYFLKVHPAFHLLLSNLLPLPTRMLL